MTADAETPSIYAALASLADGYRELVALFRDDIERRESEMRDAICAQDEIQARRVDALHTRIDEMEGNR